MILTGKQWRGCPLPLSEVASPLEDGTPWTPRASESRSEASLESQPNIGPLAQSSRSWPLWVCLLHFILKPELPALSPLLGRMSGPLTPSVPLHTSTGHHRLRLCSLGASLAAEQTQPWREGVGDLMAGGEGTRILHEPLHSPPPVLGESLLFSAGEVHLETACLEGV